MHVSLYRTEVFDNPLNIKILDRNSCNADAYNMFLFVWVDAVPDLIEHIHRTTARLLLQINRGYVDRIPKVKWEVKQLGLEHNRYVDLLLEEFKHYKTRRSHGGIRKETICGSVGITKLEACLGRERVLLI